MLDQFYEYYSDLSSLIFLFRARKHYSSLFQFENQRIEAHTHKTSKKKRKIVEVFAHLSYILLEHT